MLASMPSEAWAGVSVFPSSVTSGPVVPLLDPQAAASPVSAVAAEMATAARLSLTACSLRVAVGARPAGRARTGARHARARLLAPHDASSAPLGPGGMRKLTRKFPIK